MCDCHLRCVSLTKEQAPEVRKQGVYTHNCVPRIKPGTQWMLYKYVLNGGMNE